MAKETTDATFENDVIKSDKPVLVDFWAEWCGPCRQLGPVVDEVANDREASLDVYKVNIDHNPEKATELGVRSIPTLVLFKDGKPIATRLGALPKSALEEWIDGELAG